jgi:hypothetical protein
MNTTARPSTFRRELGDWLLHSTALLAGAALAAPFALILSAPFLGGW